MHGEYLCHGMRLVTEGVLSRKCPVMEVPCHGSVLSRKCLVTDGLPTIVIHLQNSAPSQRAPVSVHRVIFFQV